MQEKGYFDIHTHILPGVDDGAEDMETTVKMLERAYRQGVRRIIATPHYIGGKTKLVKKDLLEIVKQTQAEAGKIAEDFIIDLGNEIYYSPSSIDDLQQERASTLCGSDYVLVEFSVRISYKELYQAIRNLVENGYRPVIAHVERYECLFKEKERLTDLISLGAYLQMNANSVIGGLFDKEASYARELIKEGFIHLLGSDAHAIEYRPPIMRDAVEVLKKKKIPEALLEKILYRNPERLIQNKYI